ncbi:MAG: fumarylacetoacetate hydrolase family protein, partial [Chitinophagaceae bacterium]|nr:fumarylacetoacetate hydrolase family protein [Chitinophagaceae bacterium]
MKLVSHVQNGHEQLALYHQGRLYNMDKLHPELPNTMGMFLTYWDEVYDIAYRMNAAIAEGTVSAAKGIALAEVNLIAPVPFPVSCRDGYAFRQHVAAARRNRGVPMIPEFDQYPIFYFT